MKTGRHHSIVVGGDYELTGTESGLVIKTLDYHAESQLVSWSQLNRIGPRHAIRSPAARTQPESLSRQLAEVVSQLNDILAQLDIQHESDFKMAESLNGIRDQLVQLTEHL